MGSQKVKGTKQDLCTINSCNFADATNEEIGNTSRKLKVIIGTLVLFSFSSIITMCCHCACGGT